MSLFMGFSVISIIEIIYFITLRPYCAHRRSKEEKQVQDVKDDPIINAQRRRTFSRISLIGSIHVDKQREMLRQDEITAYPFIE